MRLALIGVVLALSGCGDDVAPGDAGSDAGAIDAPMTDGGAASPVAPAELPRFTPCPAGWREVTLDVAGGLVVCDPWPASGRATCSDREVHLPGTPGCAPVHPACPADGWPADLPSGAVIVYVRAGATAGDGSLAAPYGTIAEGVAAAPDEAIIAIGTGTYDESTFVLRPLTFWGACADTVLTSRSGTGTFNANTTTITIRNLRISSAREGIWSSESEMTLDRVIIEDLVGVGVNVIGGTVLGSDVLVQRALNAGVSVHAFGTVRFERLAIIDSGGDGIRSSNSTVALESSLILRVASGGGLPTFASDSGGLTFTRTVIESPRGEAVLSIGRLAIVMRDVVVSPGADVDIGPTTIANVMGGTIELERVRLDQLREIALLVADSGTMLDASDVAVLSVRGLGASTTAHAIEVANGADSVLERVLVADATGLGVLVDGSGTTVEARDLTVDGTLSDVTGHLGRAVQVQRGARFTLERGLFDRGREAAFVAASTLTTAELADVVIRNTVEAECAATGCPSAGLGVGVYERATARITRFRIRDNALLGLQIASDGQLDLDDGEVIGHPVGANVQVEPYDLSRLTTRVYYRDNGMNLDTRSLPVPDPTTM